jgi:preprotein translocase subunit YajC
MTHNPLVIGFGLIILVLIIVVFYYLENRR